MTTNNSTYTMWTTTQTKVTCPTPNCGTEITYETYNNVTGYSGPVIRCAKCAAQMIGSGPFQFFTTTFVGEAATGTAVFNPTGYTTTFDTLSSTVVGAIPDRFHFTGPPKDKE